jgi:GT2 family glycosyltransferase
MQLTNTDKMQSQEVLAQQKSVVVVIVTWNKRQQVLRCIESVIALSYPLQAIVVVDNASTDGTVQAIRQRFNETYPIYLIRNETNEGGSGGFYRGIEAALNFNPDYLWLLDNDVIVVRETLQELLMVIEREPRAGVVGSKIYFAKTPEIIWAIGARVNHWLATISVLGDKVRDKGQFNRVMQVDYVPMCSMLLSVEVIRIIGSVDPTYFVYGDDADFCTRTKQAGFQILAAPNSVARHDVTLNSQSLSPFAAYYFTRNYTHYFFKFAPIWYKPVVALFLLLFLMRRLLATIKYWPGFAAFVDIEKATLAGFFDACRGIRGQVY